MSHQPGCEWAEDFCAGVPLRDLRECRCRLPDLYDALDPKDGLKRYRVQRQEIRRESS